MSVFLLRKLIREEIGRNLMRGQRVDHYPWVMDTHRISIIRDMLSGKFWAYVEEIETGEVKKHLLPTETEARFWAQDYIEKLKRAQFSNIK